ncbi:MAG TPA: phosphoribosylformylglycinamidine cyclo-ligase [Capsulimonadaceae bacterium]|jgi:phosphoribosylformylglycinamidine cyclo-ligase
MSNEEKSAYAAAGVDINAAEDAVSRMKKHIASTRIAGVLTSEVGSFGGMFALRDAKFGGGTMADPVLVSSIDGVGTKLKVAFLANKHDTIGHDLVSHCTNDILVQGARPLFFLDYFATGKLEPHVAEAVVKGLSEGCVEAGCVLIGGETAEMPGLYNGSEYDLAGCIVGIVDRAKIVDGSTVKAGDVLIGLASEGLHTNGYSLARKVLLSDNGWSVSTKLDDLGVTVGEALLWPHRCYLKAMVPLLDSGNTIKAMAHITGGGLTDNVPRTLPAGLGAQIDRHTWPVPPLFELIGRAGDIDGLEMMRAFNMGIGFVVIVSAEDAGTVIGNLRDSGETVYQIGTVIEGSGVSYRN